MSLNVTIRKPTAMASIRKRTWNSGGETKTAWVVDYFDQDGKRRLKTFARRADAKEWSVTTLHDVNAPRGVFFMSRIVIISDRDFQAFTSHCRRLHATHSRATWTRLSYRRGAPGALGEPALDRRARH
jgi:hypothetical protein